MTRSARPPFSTCERSAQAIEEVTRTSRELLDKLVTNAPPKDRETEAAKARERAQKRYAA
jgi:hypothetical protein